jgi:hypothetical protein
MLQRIQPEPINTIQTILLHTTPSSINGRINIIENDPKIQFQFQEKIAIKNKATEYREALSGTWEEDMVSKLFFSKENIQIIQNGIRAKVYKMSGDKIVVAPPNIDAIKVVMRSTFLQYAQHKTTQITEQIESLNELVWDYCVPTLYKEVMGYQKYLEDASSMYKPLEIPRHHDRNYKQLILKQWF